MGVNDELANAVLRNTHRTVAFEKTVNQQIRGNLVELERELARMLGDADLESALPRFQEQRLTRLRKDVNEAINTTYLGNTRDLQAGLTEIAAQTQRLTIQSFNKVFTYDIFDVTLTRAELRTLARNPVVLGGTTTENWFKQNRGLKQGFVERMRLGLAQGETNQQLVNRLIGTPTGARETVIIKGKKRSVQLRSGGLMDVPKHQATALVRTSAQTVSNETLDTIYRDNDDVIGGIATIVTLDGRTTLICMSLSGASWDVKTGDPLPESPKQIPYPGPPPYHWQCRTVVSPITKSWEELFGKKKAEILDIAKRPDSVRASMNGEVPGRQQYTGFLNEQGAKFQNSVMGKSRAQLFRDGKIELHHLTDAMLRPLSLAQLEKIAA